MKRMKRFGTCGLLVCLLLCISVIAVGAAEIDGLNYEINEGTVTITEYTGTASHVVIPETIEGYPVTVIDGYAFYKNEDITELTLPGSIQSFGRGSFVGCKNLTRVNITDLDAFCKIDHPDDFCSPFAGATIPGELYLNGELVTEIVIPEGQTEIEAYQFYNFGGITSVVIPDSVTNIQAYAFYNCAQLKNLHLGSGIGILNAYAFKKCNALENVYIKDVNALSGWDFIHELESNPLEKAENLYVNGIVSNALVLPEGMKTIPMQLFEGCAAITSVTIPASMESVEYNAFASCKNLKTVRINCDAAVFGDNVFAWCDNLEEIIFAPDTTEIPVGIATGAKNLKQIDIPDSVRSIGGGAFSDCDSLTEVTIPGKVTLIGESAFEFSEGIQKLTLGACVEKIEKNAFYYCNALTDVYYAGSESQWKAVSIGLGNDPLLNATMHFNADNGESPDKPIEPEDPKDNPFTDVKEEKYYYDAVLWAVSKNITTGKTATTFDPNDSCTRKQIVTFLWRAAGEPEPASRINPFSDIPADKYYTDAVLWAYYAGVTTGKDATTFDPDGPCTRAQVVTFLWRSVNQPAPERAENPFTDVQQGKYYTNAVLWALENGITTGQTATSFAPNETCTRAQVVTFLYRAFEA